MAEMYSFHELKKMAKRNIEGKETRMAVLGNCSTQFFSMAIQGYAKYSNINLSVYDADYNQIEQQLIDISSEVYSYKPDIIVLYLSSEKIYEDFLDKSITEKEDMAEKLAKTITNYWDLISKNTNCRIIQIGLSYIDDKVLGNYSDKVICSFNYQLTKLNYLLKESESKYAEVYPVDLLSIQVLLGNSVFYDPVLYYNAKMSISMDALPYIAKATVDVIKAINGTIKKCVICDLDNTLWGGVIGDDGIGGIEIGELGRGHAFTNLQRWLKQLKECGIILAICSKNNEETAKEPFEKHEEMILRLSDISVFVANWNDKGSNIRLIQQTLNIGMDSIVFLDDNPFERNLVRQMISEIEVPELPEDPAFYLSFLQEQNYFETASFTGIHSDRTTLYQAEFERKKLEQSFESIDDYLKSLEMIAETRPFEPTKYSRIAQLSQRSNQFNLRTIRYSEDEIARIAEDKKYITLCFSLSDRFGDHGLISVVILEIISSNELFVDTWFMSCRVLKRGMEEYIINKVMETAKTKGYGVVKAEYIPTAKNKMVEDIFKRFGFDEYTKNNYRISVDSYTRRNSYIVEAR